MKINWWKWGVLVAIAAAIFYGGWKCGRGGPVAPGIVKADTVYLSGRIDTFYVPAPYKVVEYMSTVEYRTDTLETVEVFLPDTMAILQDYLATRYYSDTVKIDHGQAVIADTISRNRITGRGVKATMNVPVIKETVTLYQPPSRILYLGFSGQGGKDNFFYSIGADLSYKVRNDRIYSAGVNLTKDNQVLYEAGVKFPIKLWGKIYDQRGR